MIINLSEYREIHEQKKTVIWEFILEYCFYDYMKASIIYEDITETVKSVNKHYDMILRKLKGVN